MRSRRLRAPLTILVLLLAVGASSCAMHDHASNADDWGFSGKRLATLHTVLSDPQYFHVYFPTAATSSASFFEIRFYSSDGVLRGTAALSWDEAYVIDRSGTVLGQARAFPKRTELYNPEGYLLASVQQTNVMKKLPPPK